MDIEYVLKQWEDDCSINTLNLVETSRQTPMLHAKYLHTLSKAKLALKKSQLDQKPLLLQKWKYYNGKMTEQEIKDLGWKFDPLDGLKVLKNEMDKYYDADLDIRESEEKIAYYKVCVETLTDIVDNLRFRSNTISNIIKIKAFEAGD
jgi:hypothetical protein